MTHTHGPTHGIDELRASLNAHADTAIDAVPAATHVARGAALHTRIRRARNQRRAGVVGGIAAALLVTGGVIATTALPDRHSAGPQIAGHTLESTIEVNGFGYELGTTAQSSPGSDRLRITLPATEHSRYVRLVGTGIGEGDATLLTGSDVPKADRHGTTTYDAGGVLDRIATDDALDAPVEVPADKTTLTVQVRDQSSSAVVGLAVYDQGPALPEGVSADGMAFPQSIGASRLVTGVIGERGQDSVTITFQGPVRHPDLESLCATTSKDITGHVTETGAKGWSGGECAAFDRAYDVNLGVGHGEGVPSSGYGPGTHTLTLTAMHHAPHVRQDTPVDLDDVRLALGLYDDTSATRTVDGTDWDSQLLSGGRMWHLDEAVPYREGVSVDATSGPVMLAVSMPGQADYCLTATGSQGDVFDFDCQSSNVGGASGTWGEVLMPGATYALTTSTMDDAHRPGHGIGHVLVYRPAQ